LSGLLLEIDLARERGFGEIVPAFADGELRLLGQLLNMLGEHLALTRGLKPPSHYHLVIGAKLIDGKVHFSDSLPHHGGATGSFEAVNAVLKFTRQQPRNSLKDRFSYHPSSSNVMGGCGGVENGVPGNAEVLRQSARSR
jgi:hypothetical protein